MGPESDIDFLAVLRKEQDEDVRGTRPVQVTPLLERTFAKIGALGIAFYGRSSNWTLAL